MDDLKWAIINMQKECEDVSVLGSFMENHDNARFPSGNPDMMIVKNALAFTMMTDGIPISASSFILLGWLITANPIYSLLRSRTALCRRTGSQ